MNMFRLLRLPSGHNAPYIRQPSCSELHRQWSPECTACLSTSYSASCRPRGQPWFVTHPLLLNQRAGLRQQFTAVVYYITSTKRCDLEEEPEISRARTLQSYRNADNPQPLVPIRVLLKRNHIHTNVRAWLKRRNMPSPPYIRAQLEHQPQTTYKWCRNRKTDGNWIQHGVSPWLGPTLCSGQRPGCRVGSFCAQREQEAGDPLPAEQLLPLIYEELRKLAAARMFRESPNGMCQ